jgi:hypothetical protein
MHAWLASVCGGQRVAAVSDHVSATVTASAGPLVRSPVLLRARARCR